MSNHRQARCLLVAVALIVAVHDASAGILELSLPSVRDNTLFESDSGSVSNGAGRAVYVGDNFSLNTRRAMLFFDVAGRIPPGTTILAAELRLHVSMVPVVTARNVGVHRVLADWGEGDSFAFGGTPVPAEPGDATWLHRFFPDVFWANVGGDFDASLTAVTAVADTGSYVWTSPQLVANVQSWVNNPTTEFGWMLRGEEGVPRSAREIDSRESLTPALRPVLWIRLDSPAVNVAEPWQATSWSRTKAVYRR